MSFANYKITKGAVEENAYSITDDSLSALARLVSNGISQIH